MCLSQLHLYPEPPGYLSVKAQGGAALPLFVLIPPRCWFDSEYHLLLGGEKDDCQLLRVYFPLHLNC